MDDMTKSRRGFLAITLALVATTAMTAPVKAAPFKTYFGAISVKDPIYGAVGNGTADDTAAVQAAFNVAYGPISSPHGQSNPFLNYVVVFPPGNYKITSPLYMADVSGGLIQGSGNGTSQLLWRPTNGATIPGGGTYSGSGNSLIGDAQTPCICTDGVVGLRIENISIAGPSTTATSDICGVYIATSGSHGQASGSTFANITFSAMGVGILAGGGTGAGCDDGTVLNCQFNNCTLAGVRTVSANALNWSIFGGGASNCGVNSTFAPPSTSGNCGAAYSVAAGSIAVISGVAVSSNTWDFVNSGAEGMAIIGGSSESLNSIGCASAPITVQGMSYRNGFSLGCCWIDNRLGGSVVASGCWFNTGNNNGFGNIAKTGNSGKLILDGCGFGPEGAACGITGASASKLYMRGNEFSGTYSDLLTNFTGTVAQNI